MATNNKIVAYYRVSTKRQSYGLDAQRRAISTYANANNLNIIEEIEEKESGRECNRPGLNLAIATAKKHHATLVVAKADRLSRDLSYAAQIVFKSGIDVVALNVPDEAMRDSLLFGVYFGLAQREAEMISQRTKAALAEVAQRYEANVDNYIKQNGRAVEDVSEEEREIIRRENNWKLGKRGWKIDTAMTESAAKARKDIADKNTANLAAAAELRKFYAGVAKRNLSAAARHLNELGLYTSRGVFHDAKSVKLLIARYAI